MNDETRHSPRPLGRLQRWMQSVITHPDGVVDGITSDGARREIDVPPERIEEVVARSQALTSVERLHIYAGGYYARLLDCLQAEFPATLHALGEDAFDGLAFGYLQDYPSRSYTLGALGANFARYLAETRPARETGDETPDWADFLADLAKLERLYSDVFDGPGIERRDTLQSDDVLAVPPSDWRHVRFEPAPCLRLATFRFPVQEFASAVRNEEEASFPEPAVTYLAVSRLNYRVRRWSLSREEYDLLQSLVRGATLQKSLETAFADSDADDDTLAARLRDWFEEWTASRFFVAIRRDDPRAD
ncbi:MAG: putative DNA-binding domain-containing protein [Planctomycetaceae bacterium]